MKLVQIRVNRRLYLGKKKLETGRHCCSHQYLLWLNTINGNWILFSVCLTFFIDQQPPTSFRCIHRRYVEICLLGTSAICLSLCEGTCLYMDVGLHGPVYEAVFISCSAGVALATGDALISVNWENLEGLCVLAFHFPLRIVIRSQAYQSICHCLWSLTRSFTLSGSSASYSPAHSHTSFPAIHHQDVTMSA